VKIVDTTGSALTVYLAPDDCLLLAHACQMTAEYTDDGDKGVTQEQRIEATVYRTLADLFDSYALVGQAIGMLAPPLAGAFDLATVRREWGILPTDRKAS